MIPYLLNSSFQTSCGFHVLPLSVVRSTYPAPDVCPKRDMISMPVDVDENDMPYVLPVPVLAITLHDLPVFDVRQMRPPVSRR